MQSRVPILNLLFATCCLQEVEDNDELNFDSIGEVEELESEAVEENESST